MNLLAIETSSDACSVALQVADATRERHELGARQHTGILLPMIVELLHEANIGIADLDAVVLGNGPGSFIGMRIGASVAQGICFGAGLKLVPVSSLAAVAAEAMKQADADRVLVTQDARMSQVYLGRYRRDSNGLPVAEAMEEIRDIGEFAGLTHSYLAAGAAWQKYPELRRQNRARISDIADIPCPRASFLLELGAKSQRQGGAINADALQPSYIRREVARKPG
ncbi:MAG: tRNA (adenosine(37)-N6)-threonylcarbamoyltransferase complex dimerization subunit type 1 TsaB [Woeseiaceae bacterium]|nr:tRNA (adenosine(37)-N6)-threonylcarbamoyltransferase complex dimerization subunit type 1 TsaB [Woeseiaceae bacterium]